VTGPITFRGELDRARMHRARHRRLLDAMQAQGVDALMLLGQQNVAYATGVRVPAADQGRALHRRPVALLTADGSAPCVWTWYPDGVPDDLDAGNVRGGLDLEWDDGARALLADVPDGSVAVDEYTMPLYLAAREAGRPFADASGVLGAAKVCKTADEIECLRRAQAINEAAMVDVHAMLAPGLKATDLTATFFERIFELGISSSTVDPIWQVMPPSIADGPFTATGDVVFPTATTPRILDRGDVIFVDTGISYEGYQSDFGHTWVVGQAPDARRREQSQRWRAVVAATLERVKPGATARDLTRAAEETERGHRRPWLAHLYLAHGTGTDSAEMPFVGTDLGDAFDESLVLESGMVLVFEPVIWDDGHGGFRAEEIVAVTDDGAEVLTRLDWSDYE
jgi:Xaa-Pro aminopeptidase